MNKKILFDKLRAEIEKNLDMALAAAKTTYDIATHEDSKAENKYDTRGLEASYLAGAQAERVRDLRDTLANLSHIQIKSFDKESKIAFTALVKIQTLDKTMWVLLLPKGGGQSIQFDGKLIQVITPDSPLGSNIVAKQVDDIVVLNGKDYEIQEVH